MQPHVLPVAAILVGKSAVHGGAEASDMCAEASDVLLHGLADARRVCAVALLLQPHVLLVASILGGKAAVHGLAEASDMLLHGLTDALLVCALPLLLQPHVLLVAGILRGPVAALAAADVPLPRAAPLRALADGLAACLVLALQHLHALGILHCKLRPSSVLINCNGVVKLSGLGLGRNASMAPRADSRQSARNAIAADGFDPAEALHLAMGGGEQEGLGAAAKKAADVFSCGVLIFWTLTYGQLDAAAGGDSRHGSDCEDLAVRVEFKDPDWAQTVTSSIVRKGLLPVVAPHTRHEQIAGQHEGSSQVSLRLR